MNHNSLTIVELIEIDPPQRPQRPQPEPQPPARGFLCRHIFTDGHRCGSPALRQQHFCYYHQIHRTPVLANQRRRQPRSGFDLARLDGLDNPTAIQLALAEVLGRIAENTIDPKRAGLLLYGLQIAGRNLRRSRPAAEPLAEAIVEDAAHGQLAELEEGRIVPPPFSYSEALSPQRLAPPLTDPNRLNSPQPPARNAQSALTASPQSPEVQTQPPRPQDFS